MVAESGGIGNSGGGDQPPAVGRDQVPVDPAVIAVDGKTAARLTSLSPSFLHNLARDRLVPHCRVGGRVVYLPDSLRAWLKAREIQPQDQGARP